MIRRAPALAALLALVMGLLARSGRADDPAPGDPPAEPPAMEGDPDAGKPAPDVPPDPDAADGPVPFVESVNKAIDRGVAWLKRRQLANGTWGPIGGLPYGGGKGEVYSYPTGTTALALYALLKCHVPLADPVVKKGFEALRSRGKLPGSSYETSMTLLAVTATADPFKRVAASAAAGERVKLEKEARKWAQALVDDLLRRRATGAIGWRYNQSPPRPDEEETAHGLVDLSSTQLACLALFAAERCGLKVDSRVWNDAIDAATSHQEADGPESPRAVFPREAQKAKSPAGAPPPESRYAPPATEDLPKDHARGFSYLVGASLPRGEGLASGSMTGCGLGVILMARHVLAMRDDKVYRARDKDALQRSIYDGFAWLDANWSPFKNPVADQTYHVYYLYCVERAMDLAGCALLGSHNWYVEMGEQLLGIQKEDGHWDSQSTHPPYDVLDTSFALLFLKRATRGGIPYPSVTGGSDTPPSDSR